MNFINLRSVFNRKVRAKNPLLFIYKPVVKNSSEPTQILKCRTDRKNNNRNSIKSDLIILEL